MPTIFDALYTQLSSFTALTALVGNRIRPQRIPASDDLRAGAVLLIDPLEEDNQLDLSEQGGAELLKLRFRCVASSSFAAAYNVAQALYFNGTNPASGLGGGFKATVLGIPITSVTLGKKEFPFEYFEDGSDDGYHMVDWHAEIAYSEPL